MRYQGIKRFTILLLLASVLFAVRLNAQTSKAYIAVGSNITDDYLTESGNSQVGTRLGLNIGPGVSIQFDSRLEMSIELLYSQNGHYSNPVQIPGVALNKLSLHYIEAPLTLGYCFNNRKNDKEYFPKFGIGGGISYAHLFNYKIIAIDGTNVTNEVRFDQENVFLFNFSSTLYINQSFALNGRLTLFEFKESTGALRLLYYI